MASPQQEILLKEADSHVDKSQSRCDRATLTFADIWRSWWLLELLSVLVGIASIVALCALLKNRDGKAAPRTNVVAGVDITLNTIVAILSTVGRATLLLAVSECISQLKWTWYLNKHRPLEDLDTFDNASRGAWGGLVLLWKINIRYVPFSGPPPGKRVLTVCTARLPPWALCWSWQDLQLTLFLNNWSTTMCERFKVHQAAPVFSLRFPGVIAQRILVTPLVRAAPYFCALGRADTP